MIRLLSWCRSLQVFSGNGKGDFGMKRKDVFYAFSRDGKPQRRQPGLENFLEYPQTTLAIIMPAKRLCHNAQFTFEVILNEVKNLIITIC